jgi:hypothetical protein
VKDPNAKSTDALPCPEVAKYEGQTLTFKVELKDSISSGKKSITLNDTQIIKDLKM